MVRCPLYNLKAFFLIAALACLCGCGQKDPLDASVKAELESIYQCSARGECSHSHGKSLAELQRELAERPNDPVVRAKVIHQAIGENHPKLAIEQCLAILEKEPDNEYATSHMATALAEQGDLNKAMHYAAKNLTKYPSAFNHVVIAHVFYRQGRMDRAGEMFQKALDLEPGNAEAHEGVRRCAAAISRQQS